MNNSVVFIILCFFSPFIFAVTVVDPGAGVGTGTFGRNNQMELDGMGNPVVAFSDTDSLYILHCNDSVCAGGDDSAVKLLSNLNSVPAYFGFQLSVSDYPVLSYYDNNTSDLMIIHCIDTHCRLTPEINTIASVDDIGTRSDLVLDGSGFPVVTYANASTDDLYLLHCNDAFCAGGDDVPINIYNGSIIIGEQSLVLDNSGFPVVAFEGDYKPNLIRCNDVNCSGGDESFQTLNNDTPGIFVTLTLNSSGFPMVLIDVSGGSTLIHCNDLNCDPSVNGAEIKNVVNGTGNYADLKLDSVGRPIIASRNGSAMTLTRCNDVNCSGNDELTSTLPGYVDYELSLAIDDLENPVTVGFASPGLRFAHCNDGFCSGNNEAAGYVNTIKIDVGSFADMIKTGSEFLWSYYDQTNGNLKIRRCVDSSCTNFSDVMAVIENGPGLNFGRYNSVALSNDDKPVISFYDDINQSMNVVSCHNSACSTFDMVTVDAQADVGHFTTLLLDGAGMPVVSYYSSGNDSLYLAHCDAVNCLSFSNNISSLGFGGEFNDMKLDASGFPVISYFDSFFSNLNIVHCNDVNCDASVNGAENFNVLDGDVNQASVGFGKYTSLELDQMGMPTVSYYDEINGALKVIHCTDANCDSAVNGAEIISTVDDGNGNDVGYFTSLAIDDDTLPVISYYDMDAMNIMLLKCNDESCANPTTNKVVAVNDIIINNYTKLSVDNGVAYISYYNAETKSLEMVELPIPDIIFKDGFN